VLVVSVRSLDRSSFQAFVDFDPDAAWGDQKALAVLGHGDKRHLEVVSVANVWKRHKHRHHILDSKVNEYLHSRLWSNKIMERKKPWLDGSNRDLKKRYAQREERVKDFENPLPDHLLIRILYPYMTEKSTLSKPRFEEKVYQFDYNELTKSVDLYDLFKDALCLVETKSNGCKWTLELKNFTLSSKIQALYDELNEGNKSRKVANLLSKYEDQIDDGELKIKLSFDKAMLKKTVASRGGDEGREAGIAKAKDEKEQFTPTIDEETSQSKCFGLDEWYNAYEKEGKKAFTQETARIKEAEKRRLEEGMQRIKRRHAEELRLEQQREQHRHAVAAAGKPVVYWKDVYHGDYDASSSSDDYGGGYGRSGYGGG